MHKFMKNTLNSEIKFFSLNTIPELLNDYASFHKFIKGQTIFYKNHIPYGLFIIISGEVEIKYGFSKKENINSPAFLGINAFTNKTGYLFTVKALNDCDTYFISHPQYQILTHIKHPIVNWINQYI